MGELNRVLVAGVWVVSVIGCGEDAVVPLPEEPELIAGITAAHNQVRDTVGTAHLVWDADLAGIAQNYVNKCVFQHNQNRSDTYPEYVGENLYAGSAMPTGQGVTDAWASEVAYYTYETNSCQDGKACGHYTQVVWHNTTKIGCGVSKCSNGYIVACNYAPGGNYVGQKPY